MFALLAAQLRDQRAGHLLGDRIFEAEQILHLVVEAGRPGGRRRLDVDELHGDAHAVAEPLDAAFHDEFDAEFAAGGNGIDRRGVFHHGAGSPHGNPADVAQLRDEGIGDPKAEIAVRRAVGRKQLEREHRDGTRRYRDGFAAGGLGRVIRNRGSGEAGPDVGGELLDRGIAFVGRGLHCLVDHASKLGGEQAHGLGETLTGERQRILPLERWRGAGP